MAGRLLAHRGSVSAVKHDDQIDALTQFLNWRRQRNDNLGLCSTCSNPDAPHASWPDSSARRLGRKMDTSTTIYDAGDPCGRAAGHGVKPAEARAVHMSGVQIDGYDARGGCRRCSLQRLQHRFRYEWQYHVIASLAGGAMLRCVLASGHHGWRALRKLRESRRQNDGCGRRYPRRSYGVERWDRKARSAGSGRRGASESQLPIMPVSRDLGTNSIVVVFYHYSDGR